MIDKTQRLAVLMQSEAAKLPGEWGAILKAAGILIEHQHDKIEAMREVLEMLVGDFPEGTPGIDPLITRKARAVLSQVHGTDR